MSKPTLISGQTAATFAPMCVASLAAWGVAPIGAHAETINVPRDQPSIAAAIAAAAATGDEVVVAPGTYNEAIDFAGKSLALRSSGGSAVTTLSGVGLVASIVKCEGAGPEIAVCRLEGFTLSEGSAGTVFPMPLPFSPMLKGGGAVFARGFIDLTIAACRFDGNTVVNDVPNFLYGRGGAVEVVTEAATAVQIQDCQFEDNSSNMGGAINQDGTAAGAGLIVSNCTFGNNDAVYSGAAIASLFARVEVHCSLFADGYAKLGGAIGVHDAPSGSVVRGCSFVENTTLPQSGAAEGAGGALYLQRSNIRVIDSVFRENFTNGKGGALFADESHVICANSVFDSNHALDAAGGLYFNRTDGSELFNASKLVNCVVVNNTSNDTSVSAGGVQAAASTPLRVTNSIIRGNTRSGVPANITNTDRPGWVYVGHSNVQSGVWGHVTQQSNYNQDPMFVNPSGGDYRVLPESSGIDRGDPWDVVVCGLEADVTGNPRILDSNNDGTAMPDVGLYEAAGPVAPFGNAAPNLLAFWHFNDVGTSPFAADVGEGEINASGWSGGSSLSDVSSFANEINRLWDIPGLTGLRLNGLNQGDSLDLRVSMEGRVALVLTFMMKADTPTSAMPLVLEWSASGSGFEPVPDEMVQPFLHDQLQGYEIDCSALLAMNGAMEMVFRMRAIASGTGDHWVMLDNVRVDATPLKDLPAADLNQDGSVDGADLGLLLGSWGTCVGCAADINGDRLVDGADLGMLLGQWAP